MDPRTATATMDSRAATASQVKATLTNNPQDSSEIPSLFQTFVAPDASSGEDEDAEVLAVHTADDYGTPAASSGRVGSIARSGGGAAAYPAAPLSASRAAATTSLNAGRNRHPFNRSTHNPYVLLSSTDGTTLYGSEASSIPAAGTSATGLQAHRCSSSNSTSQNPLTFEFNSSTTAGEVNANCNSPGAMGGSGIGMRRPPSQLLHSLSQSPAHHQQQQQQHGMREPVEGYRRDGNPMSMSSTGIRLVANTTVGPLSSASAAGDAPTVSVNAHQRVRTTGSRTNSLSKSHITTPVIQAMPQSPSDISSAAANATTPTFACGALPRPSSTSLPESPSAMSRASDEGMRRGVSSFSTGSGRRPSPSSVGDPLSALPVSSNTNNNSNIRSSSRSRMITVPLSVLFNARDAEDQWASSVGGHGSDSPNHHHQQQQQQQPQYGRSTPRELSVQQQRQQHYYGYRGHHVSPQQQPVPYAHSLTGYVEQAYPAIPSQGHPYPMPHPQQQQQQQYHSHQQHGMAMVPRAPSSGGCTNPYGQIAPSPSYYMGGGGGPGVASHMMQGYGYPAVPGVQRPSHAPAMQQQHAGYGESRGRRGSGSRSQLQKRRQQYPANPTPAEAQAAAPSPPAQSAATTSPITSTSNGTSAFKNKDPNAKGRVQQGKQANTKRASPASPHGKDGAPSSPTPSSPPKLTPAKSQKRLDEASLHADRSAVVQLFVVVKRRMEGQRYACALPAEEVPVGSHVLVEGDRGADLGEVLAHVSFEQMAHDCAVVERRRRAALEKLQEMRVAAAAANASATPVPTAEISGMAAAAASSTAKNEGDDGAGVIQLTGDAARNFVLSLKNWPRLIGPATPSDVDSLGSQREAEQQAFATARPIVQQYIENRYQQRVARNAQVLRTAENPSTGAEADAAVVKTAAAAGGGDASSEDGECHACLTPLTEEELRTLEPGRQVTLVDCEYQFTRGKMTLFVSRPARSIFVDFRRMQRKLYRTFRCRIWIAYMDEIADDEDAPESFVFVPPPSSTSAAAAAAAPAAATGAEEGASSK